MTNLLIVRIPYSEDLASLAKLRDYVLESLRLGVLVVDENTVCEVMELPQLCGAEVRPEAGAYKCISPEAEEKRVILQRLRAFREENGVGCLGQITKRMGRSSITIETLRGILTGDTVLGIADWRRIGKALDRLETQEESANA